jgi:Outer membrane protein and related peptidoglycan-associated (lipo)proteins
MKANNLLILVACVGLFGSCATTVPKELVNAREAYRRASTGTAAQVAPAEVHVAKQALVQAEKSFKENSDSYQTRDLAYVAQRKSELAEATASIAIEQKSQTQAKSDYLETQGKIVTKTKQDLSETRTALAASENSGEMTAKQLSAEQEARAAADQRAADAQAALAKLAAVKEEPRGMVITLSGSVLFASNQATLLPSARSRLEQVADVLLTTRERNITIEGHTDSQGSDSYNLDLSQRRADAVRNYFVERGYQADRIKAHGLGKGHPIADNASAEGRANNRRVEIIIER